MSQRSDFLAFKDTLIGLQLYQISADSDRVGYGPPSQGRGSQSSQARVNGGSNYDSLKVANSETRVNGGSNSEARVNGGSNYDSLKVASYSRR